MDACRLLIEPEPQPGPWNMAVDEALLEAALERGECTLRWYRWAGATVSLGYFQDAATAAPELAGLPMVRRLSGGGAILHHHEWTYSCAVPAGHPLAVTPQVLYRGVHERIIGVLSRYGITVRMRGEAAPEKDAAFLCFGRGDAKDVVLAGHKVLGSAQRRRRGAVLQHGSLLLSRSPHAPQFPGILDLTGLPPSVGRISNPSEQHPASMGSDGLKIRPTEGGPLVNSSSPEFAEELASEVGRLLGRRTVPAVLSGADRRRAVVLDREKYARLDWRPVQIDPER